jgi:ABC-type transport system substrate-binding protein
VKSFDPTIFKWMYFLTGYVLPKAYFEKAGPEGFEAAPISDIGMIFLKDIEVMTDPSVRKAAALAIDKQAIIDPLLSGYGVKIDTLQAPECDAYDPSISVPYDEAGAVAALAASGFGLRAGKSGQVQDPDHQGLQAQGSRDGAGHRRSLAQGGNRGGNRGLRDRQAL